MNIKRIILLIGSAVMMASIVGCGSSEETADMTPPKGAESAPMNSAGAGTGGGVKIQGQPAQAPN